MRVVPLDSLAADGKTRKPLAGIDITALAARFTMLELEIFPKDGLTLVELTSAAGELKFLPSAGGIVIEGPVTRMAPVYSSTANSFKYFLRLTEPRLNHPLGPLVWTLCKGQVSLT